MRADVRCVNGLLDVCRCEVCRVTVLLDVCRCEVSSVMLANTHVFVPLGL